MQSEGYPPAWAEAITSYLALTIDRIADRGSAICHWDLGYEKVTNTFTGFRFPINWDFAEATDPPYYDAIPYSDLMDFFYIWLRRTLHGLFPGTDAAFLTPLGPKWDHQTN